jgi:ABC-2 type transport system permease protein
VSSIPAPVSRPVPATGVGGDRSSGEGYSLPRVIRSEWTKLWSLRSTRWSLLVAFVAMAGLGPLIAVITMSQWNHLSVADKLSFNSIDHALGGFHIAQLAIAVLGVLIVSGEYSTGQIRSSLMAVPTRLPVLWAKLIVFSGVTFVLILIASVIGFFASMAIFTQHHVNATLSSPGALRAVLGVALYMVITAIVCIGLGTIVRATAGGISSFVALLFVLPGIVEILPNSVNNAISPYLLSSAGQDIAQAASGSLAPWTGFAVACGYAAVAVVFAAWLLRRRDA